MLDLDRCEARLVERQLRRVEARRGLIRLVVGDPVRKIRGEIVVDAPQAADQRAIDRLVFGHGDRADEAQAADLGRRLRRRREDEGEAERGKQRGRKREDTMSLHDAGAVGL